MLASEIFNSVSITLSDTSNVAWPLTTLAKYLNAAQRQIVLVRPDANSKIASHSLISGAKQSLPADGIRLLGIPRNMGVDGLSPGRVISITDDQTLGAFNLDWHAMTPTAVIEHYLYNEKNPKTFYVYPPHDGSSQVELNYVAQPTDVVDGTSSIALDDIYETPLIEWMLYLCFGEETDSVTSQAESKSYYRQFFNSLGIKIKSDYQVSPNKEKDEK